MGTKTKSARGTVVDFDLMKIKSQIASAPKTVDVKKREDFIDRKLRRRVKRAQTNIDQFSEKSISETKTPDQPDVLAEPTSEPKKRKIKKKRT